MQDRSANTTSIILNSSRINKFCTRRFKPISADFLSIIISTHVTLISKKCWKNKIYIDWNMWKINLYHALSTLFFIASGERSAYIPRALSAGSRDCWTSRHQLAIGECCNGSQLWDYFVCWAVFTGPWWRWCFGVRRCRGLVEKINFVGFIGVGCWSKQRGNMAAFCGQ